MKKIKVIYKALIVLFIINACTENENLEYLENIAPPSNVLAVYTIAQDNTGVVILTPTAESAVSFDIHFGDASAEPAKIEQGSNAVHTYAEGTYDVTIVAYNSVGKTTEMIQPLVVSYKAPQNLVVTAENDAAVSKQVNVSATAEFAVSYDFYSGETGVTQPVATANIGDAISYQYTDAGTYSVKVIAKGGAIETTEYIVDFEVTAILAPLTSAATPPNRSELDVISIFSGSYTDLAGIDYNPNWGQQTIYTAFDLNGDAMLQYSNLNYQGIDFSANVQDASAMQTLHIDVWTADATSIDIYPISSTSGEFFVTKELVADQWNSFEIPVSDFTDQGLVISDIKQFKLVGSGSVFIDNLYFWKTPSAPSILTGTWKVASEAGSLKVGPSSGSGNWWSISDAQVLERACFYDDEFLFGADGSFKNVLGSETWLEAWQGTPDACGTPVAPYDGIVSGTFIHDDTNNKVTLNGSGNYLGIPKANNAGELPNVAVPSSITYDITLSNNNTEMEVIIEAGSGVFWTYKLVKDTALTTSPIDGTWKIAPEAGSLKVGPSSGSGDWWSISDEQVAERACFYDDEYVFNIG
ncbi:MAG: PKD repeat protein, partial [Polaribacter sp.]